MKASVYAKVGFQGWAPQHLDLEGAPQGAGPADFTLTVEERGGPVVKRITAVEEIPGGLRLVPEEFCYSWPFTLEGSGPAAGVRVTREDVAHLEVEGLDRFAARQEQGVLYRLYSPQAGGPRPLILFLHGGGEGGSDNLRQMVGTLGAIRLAELYPDYFVMAPQAPAGQFPPAMGMPQSFWNTPPQTDSGWYRGYLAAVCDLIRGMIREGLVDPCRVYVTGMSMGGGGTLRALSVGAGLFAAAAPICPTMTPDTFQILKSLTHQKIWVSASYVDHTIYRHKYIVDGILALRDAGNQEAKLTLFSPEELAAYGLGDKPGISLEQKFGENHACWNLVYNGEYGILDWLCSQHL